MRETWPAVLALAFGMPASLSLLVGELFAKPPSVGKIVGLAIAAASVLFLGVVKIAQSLHKDRSDAQQLSPEDIRAGLHVIYQMLVLHKRSISPPDAWARITFYKVIEDKELEQIVAYIGCRDGRPSHVGRRISINVGIIGRAARSGDAERVERPMWMNITDWHRWLIKDTGMTPSQAADTRPDRHDFLAIPISSDGGAPLAVVYLDACEAGFFDEATAQIVTAGCMGLVKWIGERYYQR